MFVEFRGSGKTQDALANIISSRYKVQVYSLFMTYDSGKKASNGVKYMFFPTDSRYSHDILEVLTRAPHGQTLGYEDATKNFSPVLEPEEVRGIIAAGFDEYLRGVKMYSCMYCDSLNKNSVSALSLEIFKSYFTYLNCRPESKIAHLLGRMPFGVGSYVRHIEEYAPPLSLGEVLRWGLLGFKPKRNEWGGGRLARTSLGMQKLLAISEKIRVFVENYLFDIRINSVKKIAFLKIFGARIDLRWLLRFC